MIDPLSITGLAVAIFDDLLRLCERTVEFISDVRNFDEDSKRFYDDILAENHKTRILRQLLFKDSSVYGGQSLFQQFDEDVQDQIKVSLARLVNVLEGACDILKGRYGSPARLGTTSSSVNQVASVASLSLEKSTKPPVKVERSRLLMVRWSFRDKKRVETIISDFTRLNSGIHEYIKFICLGSSIGVGIKHLEHLQKDESSVSLGFDVDAALRLTVHNARDSPGSLELDNTWTHQLLERPATQRVKVIQKDQGSYLLECRPYQFPEGQDSMLDPLTSHRVNALARLLGQHKEQIFRIPRCTGWKYLESHKTTIFVFENPSPQCNNPLTLRGLIDTDQEKPSLGSKFQLAHSLAQGIAQLHLVKWLHESFCSDNILLFPQTTLGTRLEKQLATVDYSQPWILGFDLSRPEGELSFAHAEIYPERDVYRHPDRQGYVKMQFTKIHDIYSLGVVLLEIGLWAPAVSLQSNRFKTARNPKVIQEQLIKQAERRLASHLGAKYRDLVLKCLKGDFGVTNDTKEDLKLQQAFRTQVVDVLKRAAENV